MGKRMRAFLWACATMACVTLMGCGSSSHINPNSNQWVWVSGANTAGQKGNYGTIGTSASSNTPGARSNSVSWTDFAGNLWMFGGSGYDSAGTQGLLNDLWVYGRYGWVWVGGAKVVNQSGVYGQGSAASSNVPGARANAVTWTDSRGNLWLFGGFGYDSAGALGPLNDLWVYRYNQWTWVSGSNLANQIGIYGTQGTTASSNVPGARSNAVSWTDYAGNLWLFGGSGYDSAGTLGQLNDLWVYSRNGWTWVSGSKLVNQKGAYGTKGSNGNASNTPGARSNAVSWTDANGNLWLFGGSGYDSAATQGQLNDLWVYGNNGWSWQGGANVANQKGTYGTKGTAASANTPGARANAVSWTDFGGNLWLLGGSGYDSAGAQGQLNDLWVYGNNGWEWAGGANVVNQKGTYGTQGTIAAGNMPGARSNAVSWTDSYGNLWLFGGSGYSSAGTQGALNDLWAYGF